MENALAAVSGSVGAVLLFASLLAAAWGLAFRLAPESAGSARAAAVVALAAWIPVAAFPLLVGTGLFRLWVVLPLGAAAGILSARRLLRDPAAREDLRLRTAEARDAFAALVRHPLALVALAASAVASVRVVRGLAAPPLGWDALTYHLVKAARWVQAGGFAPEPAPDAWGAYEYLPYGGDALWAFVMLPFSGDDALAAGGALVLAGVAVASYALARELGAPRAGAMLASLALVLTPSAMGFMTTAYVDNVTLLGSVAGSLFVCRLLAGAPAGEAVVAAAGLAVCASTKALGLPILALGALAVCVQLAARAGPAAPRARAIALAALAALAAAPPYLRAWIERGSPLYPLSLAIAGRVLAPGHVEMELGQAGAFNAPGTTFSWPAFLESLFLPDGLGEFLNPGPAALFLVALGLAGAARILGARRPAWKGTLFLLASSALVVQGFLGPNTLGLRTNWARVIGRFLLPALAPFAALAACSGAGPAALAAAALAGCWLAVPHGLSREDLSASLQIAGIAIGSATLAGAAAYAARRASLLARAVAAALPLLAGVALWGAVRGAARHEIWKAAGERRAYDAHLLNRVFAPTAIWKRLDDGVPRRIAVAAGWSTVGDNWYWYPYFGSRLQNEVLYVAPTSGGEVVDYRGDQDVLARASFPAWLGRLVARRVDILVLLPPAPPAETPWVRERRDLFVPFAASKDGLAMAFLVDRAAAERWLAANGRREGP